MQFESFHWLSHHGTWAIIPCSANMVSKRVIFGALLLLVSSNFLYFGGVFNKTIIPFALVGYEIGYSRPRWLFTISYPTRVHGIIVKYSPDFKTARVAKTIWRIINQDSSLHLGRKYALICPWTVSVPRNSQFSLSFAVGKLFASRNR